VLSAEGGSDATGLCFDDRGHRFICTSSGQVREVMYDTKREQQNPYYTLPRADWPLPSVPATRVIHPVGAAAPMVNRALASAAQDAGVTLDFAYVTTVADVERAFTGLRTPAATAVILGGPGHPDAVAAAYRTTARRKGIAALGGAREGALMDFALRHADAEGRIGAILDKVLRGANPAEIPFELPDRTVFAINRATATAIGIRIPSEILLRASSVID